MGIKSAETIAVNTDASHLKIVSAQKRLLIGSSITRGLGAGGYPEVAAKCANYAMRIMGAYGYSTEYPVARYFRDAPTYSMVEGSSNICKWIIARDHLGLK